MKFYIFLFLFAVTTVFSQQKIKHVVSRGESIYSIAKKYDVKESAIFDLNPKVKSSSLSLKSVLWIPNKNYRPDEKPKQAKQNDADEYIVHEVTTKETLYGISRKYGVTIAQIKKANPSLKVNQIKTGTQITIPVSKTVLASLPDLPANTMVSSENPKDEKKPEAVSQNADETITHHVLAKETKYGISKRYNISIAELEKLNPNIVNGLAIGDDLIIRQGKTKSTEVVAAAAPETTSDTTLTNTNVPTYSADALSKAEFLIAKGSENIGTPYRSGGMDKNGFDCSGFIFTTFKNIDMILPRSSSDMAANAGVKIDISQAQKGDLIFFSTRRRGGISHVGMVTEVLGDEIKFIHSSTSIGVTISSTKEDYYAKRVVQVNRVL